MDAKELPKSKVDLEHLMDSPPLSPEVAERLFASVEDVEVDIDGDIMAAAIAPEPGSLVNDVAAAHRALEDLVRSAPDSPATQDFLAWHLAHLKHAMRYFYLLRQGDFDR